MEIESYTNVKISVEKDMFLYMTNLLHGLTKREIDYYANSIFYFKNEYCYLEFHKEYSHGNSIDLWYTSEYIVEPFLFEYAPHANLNIQFNKSLRRMVEKYICSSIISFIGNKSIRPVTRPLHAVESIEDHFRKHDAEMSKRASFLCPHWDAALDI